jgi:drug/metabolite transporter (DMT)-like permease
MILSVGLALTCALFYGVSDFFGGTAARRLRVMPSTAIIYGFGTVTLAIAVPLTPGTWSAGALIWGASGGVFAVVGLLTFYAAMAIGPMSLVSPLISVLGSLVPVAIAVALGQRLEMLAWVAVALALVSALLISVQRRSSNSRVTTRTVVISLISGVTLGISLVSLDLAPRDSGLIPGLVALASGLAFIGAAAGLALIFRPVRSLVGRLDHVDARSDTLSLTQARVLAAIGGVMVGAADAFLLLALRSGSLAVVSVLIGLYPLATILLARITFKERMTPTQLVGVVLAITASAMLALS